MAEQQQSCDLDHFFQATGTQMITKTNNSCLLLLYQKPKNRLAECGGRKA
jgi:hypothetical protein